MSFRIAPRAKQGFLKLRIMVFGGQAFCPYKYVLNVGNGMGTYYR